MRAVILLPLCVWGCSVDTAHLREPVDVSRWATPTRGEDLLRPDLLSRPAGGEREPEEAPEGAAQQASAIDLATVLDLAGSKAVEIDIARASALEAAHLAEAEQARALPFLSPRIGFFRHEGLTQDTGGEFLEVDKQNAFAGTGLSVVLRPSDAIHGARAARRRAAAAGARYRADVDATLLEAAEAYFDLAESHAREAIARDDVRAARELQRVEQARREAGAGLAAAVERARARVAEAEGRLEEVRGRVQADGAELVAVLSLQPGTELLPSIADAVATLELVDPTGEITPLLDRAFARHPELDAARHAVAAAVAEEDRTRWGWLIPELRAGTTYDGFGPDFASLEDRENYFLGVQWTLDFGLPDRHEANTQRRIRASLQKAALRDRVAATVVKSRAKVLAARARVEAARRGVVSASENLRLVQARHAEGAGLLLQVLDAQAAVARARIALVTAVADHNTAQYTLLRAVGGPR